MNIAFPALLIFLLLLPGLIFVHSFYQTENVPLSLSLTRKALVSLVAALFLQVSGYFVATYVFCYHVNLHVFFILISDVHGQIAESLLSSVSSSQIYWSAIYFAIVYMSSYLIGATARWGIQELKLDTHFSFFRIDSPWYYLFTLHDQRKNVASGVRVAVILEVAGEGYLYIGWLDKYYLDDNGQLDRLVLVDARRRSIEKDKQNEDEDTLKERFYKIDGDYFIVKYAETKSLNVQYINIETSRD